MKGIKNIMFDFGGVLVDLDREAAVSRFAEIGFPQAAELLDPYLQSGIFLELEQGTVSIGEFYDYVSRHAAQPLTPEAIREALNRFLVDVPQYKLDMLLDLRKRFKVYMLSNTNEAMFPYAVEKWFSRGGRTLKDYFDSCFLSYEMKEVKPGRAIFEQVIAAGLDPAETLFLDDGPANVETAAAMGFRTYLVKPREDYRALFEGL